MEMKDTSIAQLATLMKAAGVDRETALTISLRVRKDEKRAQMIKWMEENPTATPPEICRKSREVARG
jgi:hypothetical protein